MIELIKKLDVTKDIKEKISLLEKIIIMANDAYWNNNTQIISDVQYDNFVNMLKDIDNNNELISHIGGAKGKYRHNPPMLSLDKAYKYDEIISWSNSCSRNEEEMIQIQPKYDGLAGKIENGRLTTRGDGFYGEDITSHVDLINIPHYINDINSLDGIIKKYTFEKYISLIEVYTNYPIYGELVIENQIFNEFFISGKILRSDGTKYSNPRNAVAGLFNLKDISNIPKHIITFIPYHNQSILVRNYRLKDVVESCIKEIEKSYKSQYPMDGIVFKIYDKEHYNSLGSTAHHPKGAIAFKFQNVTAESKLLDVEYGIGKENITATAIFETVNLNGVNISRASIPMKSKTLPCIINGDFKKGDIVVVEKAGDVIPHIIEIKSNNGEVFTLNKCPFCGSEIEFTDSSVKCTNINCRKKQIHKLYESLVLLGINNIGETTVDILSKYILEKNNLEINVNNWMKEFSSDKNINIINKMENFGEISANNIINETKKIKNIDLSQFIASLCIPNVGIKIGKELSKKGNDLNDILNFSIDELSSINGVGTIMAERLNNFFIKNKEYIVCMSKNFIINNDNAISSMKKICFTGAMRYNRSQMSEIAIKNNFNVIDTVTKDLNILVVSDNSDFSSSKCKKAEKYGVEIITESEFLKDYN